MLIVRDANEVYNTYLQQLSVSGVEMLQQVQASHSFVVVNGNPKSPVVLEGPFLVRLNTLKVAQMRC